MVASIEYIEQVLANVEAAAEANETTPGREGNVIELTSELADDVLISADLHGHRRNFNQILKQADLAHHPRRHLVMQEVCHGGPTYPDNGGCMSHTMLEDVCKLKAQFPDRFHFLLSNHEWAELTEYPILKGKRMLNLMFRMGLAEAYGPAGEKIRESFAPFLRSLPLGVRLPGDVLVCHSAPEHVDTEGWDHTLFDRPLDASDWKEHSDLFWLLWGRDYRPDNARAFAKKAKAKVLIHGHDPCPEGFRVPNDTQIILDCCSDKACCVLLPVGPALTQQEIVERIKKL
ncbi:MAG: metallophosphoesterase [Pirellulales bacterium]